MKLGHPAETDTRTIGEITVKASIRLSFRVPFRVKGFIETRFNFVRRFSNPFSNTKQSLNKHVVYR